MITAPTVPITLSQPPITLSLTYIYLSGAVPIMPWNGTATVGL